MEKDSNPYGALAQSLRGIVHEVSAFPESAVSRLPPPNVGWTSIVLKLNQMASVDVRCIEEYAGNSGCCPTPAKSAASVKATIIKEE